MNRLAIPGTDLSVSPLCFGCGNLGTGLKGEAAERLTGAYLDAGGNFFDTAHCYSFWVPGGNGASERELGAVLDTLGARDSVVVATKGGHPAVEPDYPRPERFLAPEVLAGDIDDSLSRLGAERIDLYYLHRDDGVTPVGEIIDALNTGVARGRLRWLGASNWSVARLAEANAYAAGRGLRGFAVSEVQWSLAVPKWSPSEADPTTRYVTDVEEAWHRDTGVPIAAYSATCGGYFAGRDAALYDTPENSARRERARELATTLGVTPSQIALAWLLCQPGLSVLPVFATGNAEHQAEILGAVSIALTPEQVRWLYGG